jgi:hypothetical protein
MAVRGRHTLGLALFLAIVTAIFWLSGGSPPAF